mmetsp:Transcript_34898/g.34563  ORF Transcript_34898/g.34563 Transcript_34898/m.34563 type:complete len:221 (-) Transcript_34898:423-1085(-)
MNKKQVPDDVIDPEKDEDIELETAVLSTRMETYPKENFLGHDLPNRNKTYKKPRRCSVRVRKFKDLPTKEMPIMTPSNLKKNLSSQKEANPKEFNFFRSKGIADANILISGFAKRSQDPLDGEPSPIDYSVNIEEAGSYHSFGPETVSHLPRKSIKETATNLNTSTTLDVDYSKKYKLGSFKVKKDYQNEHITSAFRGKSQILDEPDEISDDDNYSLFDW